MPGVSSPNSQEIQSFCPSEHSRYMRERNFDVIPSNTLTHCLLSFRKRKTFQSHRESLSNFNFDLKYQAMLLFLLLSF